MKFAKLVSLPPVFRKEMLWDVYGHGVGVVVPRFFLLSTRFFNYDAKQHHGQHGQLHHQFNNTNAAENKIVDRHKQIRKNHVVAGDESELLRGFLFWV